MNILCMKLIEEAWNELFPERSFTYSSKIRYSQKFNDYNANIRFYALRNEIVISLSKKWNSVSKDIKKGLLQELLLKMFGKNKKIRTLSMDLYHIFLKNTHLSAEKNNIDPYLLESFRRVNKTYFNEMLDQTNLIWGEYSKRTLGRYDFGSDTIRISKIFEHAPLRFLDLVMYHEMLHKKLKFNTKNGRNRHHTTEFRNAERRFEGFENTEKELQHFVRSFRVPTKQEKQLSFFERLLRL